MLDLDFGKLAAPGLKVPSFVPVPKYPPVIEDYPLTGPGHSRIGPVLSFIRSFSPLIADVRLTGSYGNARTVRIQYLDRTRNLTDSDIVPVREAFLQDLRQKFRLSLKQQSDL